MYILERTDSGGGYVSPAGGKSSYTLNPILARRYRTRDEAEADRCIVNEAVINLTTLVKSG